MATITIAVAGSGIVSNGSKVFTISDSDLQRLLTATARTLKLTGQTNAQLLLAYAGWIKTSTQNMINLSERGIAAQAALDTVTAIVMT